MAQSIGKLNALLLQRIQSLSLTWDCLADGDANARLAIVSEAPGFRESEMKIPLVGGSGELLWRCLQPYGIRRSNCYVTNVVKKQLIQLPGQKKLGVSVNELAHWKALLDWELAQLPALTHVLVLGDLALQALVGVEGIEQWRGSVVGDANRFVVTVNPAYILHKPTLEPIFRLDCAKLDIVLRGKWSEHTVATAFDPSPAEAIAYCDKMIQEGAPVGVDIETTANETACIGFANNAHTAMCINFRGRSHNRWSVQDEVSVRRAIQRVLRHANVRLIAQNGGFDCGWLWYKDRIKVRPLWMDTLLAHHTLYPIWPHNLGFLTAQYTTHPFYKDEKDSWREGGDIATFWQYNGKDCCIMWAAAMAMEKELKRLDRWDFFQNHVMALQPFLIESTVLGNLVDSKMREQLNARFEEEVNALAADFVKLARVATGVPDYECNPNSNKQVGELLFRKLGLQGKNASVDKENRAAMIANPRTSDAARDMLIVLGRYQEQHKLLSTYVKAKIDADQRMRSDYKQYGVANTPGRLSSAQTLWGTGMNLQNQPEQLRGMFIADRMVFDD